MQIRRFSAYYRPHRRLFALDMGTAVARSLFVICIPWISRRILGEWVPEQNWRMVVLYTLLCLLLALAMCFADYINTRWGHVLGTRIETDMRRDLFRHLQKLSFSYFDNTKTGHLMSRISNDLFNISEVAHHAPENLLIAVITLIGAIVFMLFISPAMTLIAVIPIPLMLLWGGFFGLRLRASFREVRRTVADINSNVENAIQGIREVKSYANEPRQLQQFGTVNGRFRSAKERMYSKMAHFHSGMHFLSESYRILIVAAGAWGCLTHRIDMADVVAFLLYVGFIMDPIRRVVHFIETYQQGLASFERFTEIMDIEPEIQDRPHPVTLDNVEGCISINDLSFRYGPDLPTVLAHINMHIPAGATVALVGESGAGKSTLASLLPRFYEAKQGLITLDDVNVLDLPQRALREAIGIVQQTPFMFDATLRENILFGRPDATEEQMIQAARQANILDFITSLPEGFDALVGEHGVKLSGGQKQRIAIARVFLKNPPVLIFDEATSSLDTESEQLIQIAMERLCKGRTTLIIAHRLSTVRTADLTYVLQSGKVVEQGTHTQLIDAQGYYYRLYTTGAVIG